jgi:hypothetical protein
MGAGSSAAKKAKSLPPEDDDIYLNFKDVDPTQSAVEVPLVYLVTYKAEMTVEKQYRNTEFWFRNRFAHIPISKKNQPMERMRSQSI